MLVKLTSPDGTVYLNTDFITFVRDDGDLRVVDLPDSHRRAVEEPLQSFLELGFEAATGTGGEPYAVNPATVVCVEPYADSVVLRFVRGRSAIQVTEYLGIPSA